MYSLQLPILSHHLLPTVAVCQCQETVAAYHFLLTCLEKTCPNDSLFRPDINTIDSGLLETQDNPTQPPSPPAEVSSSGSSDVPVILIDDTDSDNVTNRNRNNNIPTTNQNDTRSTISLSDFRTLSTSTNGTFNSDSLLEQDRENA